MRKRSGKQSRRAPAKPATKTATKTAPNLAGRPRPKATSKPQTKAATAPTAERNLPRPGLFPIVGIGASAGGLEAIEEFLKHVPERSGMAFVIIQHLDPTRKGVMPELLQRVTTMPVAQVKDRTKVEPDRVYLIPPNKDMSILHGVLHLLPQTSPRGLNLPIDFFFRSLAEDQQERSIGVVLSGMGSDGTLGLRAIKAKAGVVFVQALTSAKFDSMPRSAIDAGLADVVAPAEQLPEKILSFRHHAPYLGQPEIAMQDAAQSALDKVFVLLRARTGNDFSSYKRNTIYRRIERRMGLHQINKLSNYIRFLRENPGEIDLLFKELLIGVTSFFRDPPAWEQIKNEILPALISARTKGGILRAWVPGCSTGEEAYSLAIAFKEALEVVTPVKHVTLQIFATDLDRDAIEKARLGSYPTNIAADVSHERLRRHFVQDERGYRVNKEIRELVIFAPQNLIMDPPFTKLDFLSCRNLLIYLSLDLQKKLLPLFHYCLNPAGVLFLGSAETVGAFSELFTAPDGKTRLFRRREQPAGATAVDFPTSLVTTDIPVEQKEMPVAPSKPSPQNLQALADRAIAHRLSPPVVLTTDKGDILYISGRTGKYLEPAAGKANMNIFAMAREGLRAELSSAFSAVLKSDLPATAPGVRVGTDGGLRTVDITVQKVVEPKELKGTIMVVIQEVVNAPAPAAKGKHRSSSPRNAELEHQLLLSHEELRSAREVMQTSQEELRSTNEELQSTNEELQSTNEELTTSKEEMQSMNEELQTVNQELQSKVDELSHSNNDMKNLLNSTDIATLFLDGELRVGRFTTQTSKIIKLIPGDAGRPITDIVTALDYPDLAEDAREVLRTLVFKEKVVAATDNRWFSVRIMPYRTLENVIAGLVITFTDASVSKQLETAMRRKEGQLRELADALPQLVWSCAADGAVDYLSRQWVDYTGVAEAGQLGQGWLEQVFPDDRERVRAEWSAAVNGGTSFESEFRIRRADGAQRWFKTRAAPIRDAKGLVCKWYGTSTDIDDIARRT